jgi:hypothetical protein
VAYPAFDDPKLGEIYRYWLSKRRDGKHPRRADIRPAELGAAVRHINLIDVIREPGKALQYRHRLVGTHNIEWLGRDATGRMVDESLYGPATAAILASLNRIVAEARPFYRRNRMDWNNQKFLTHEAVEMPLSDDSHAVAIILRGASFRPAASQDDLPPVFEALPLD